VHFWKESRDRSSSGTCCATTRAASASASSPPARSHGPGPTRPARPRGVATWTTFGGVARNNVVSPTTRGSSPPSSGSGLRGVPVAGLRGPGPPQHRLVRRSRVSFSSVEWRFAWTSAAVTKQPRERLPPERDGASATLAGNVTGAAADWFVGAASGDLHLAPRRRRRSTGAVVTGVTDDLDGEPRLAGRPRTWGPTRRGRSRPAGWRTRFFTVTPCRRVDTRSVRSAGRCPSPRAA